MSGIRCALDLRLAYVDADGVPTGAYLGIINPVKLALNTPDPDKVQRISRERDSAGQALDEITTSKPTEVELSTDDTGDAEVLAWALNGEAIGYTQAGGVIAAATYAVESGKWVKMPHRGLSAVVVKSTDDATTYVANTDYLVDPVSGFIKITDAGAIATGNVKIAYTAGALTGKKINAGTTAAIFVSIDGEGINQANGRPVNISIPRASLSASGALDFVGADFLVTELKGTAIKVTGREVAEVLYLD